jgi:hypothetical protein
MERKTRENKIKGIPAIDMLEKVLELEEKLSDINNHDWQWSMGSQTAITEKLNRILEDLEADDIYEWNNPFDDDDMIFHKNGEEIVNLLIEHHLRVVDGTQYGPALEFVWTTKSPLYRGMNRIKDTNLGGYFADRIM